MKPICYWNGVGVSQEDRDLMVKDVFNELAKSPQRTDESSLMTGDTLIVGSKRTREDGSVHIEVIDCLVRRNTTYTPDGEYSYEPIGPPSITWFED